MKKPVYVEPHHGGGFSAKLPHARRASAIEPTQARAIATVRQMHPDAAVHVARVRHTSRGNPDQYRKL